MMSKAIRGLRGPALIALAAALLAANVGKDTGLIAAEAIVLLAIGAFLSYKAYNEQPSVFVEAGSMSKERNLQSRRFPMQAADIMTRQVITIAPDASILQAVHLMLQNRISGLPVVDVHGLLVGIITEGDFLRRTETGTERRRPSWLQFLTSEGTLADEYVRTHGRKIEEVMTCKPYTVSEATPLEEVVRIMERKNVKRVPVLREGRLVGIITRANLLHALTRLAETSRPAEGGDTAIRDRIRSQLAKLPWRSTVTVHVRDGVVDLSGTIMSEGEREALKVAVENVPGVKAIHDHVVWVEPNSGMVFVSPEDEKTEARSWM